MWLDHLHEVKKHREAGAKKAAETRKNKKKQKEDKSNQSQLSSKTKVITLLTVGCFKAKLYTAWGSLHACNTCTVLYCIFVSITL